MNWHILFEEDLRIEEENKALVDFVKFMKPIGCTENYKTCPHKDDCFLKPRTRI